MKILWVSNSPRVGTGYGTQTATWLTRLVRDYDLALLSYYGIQGHTLGHHFDLPSGKKTVIEYPAWREPFANDLVGGVYQLSKSDVTITLIDPFVLEPDVWRPLNWCAWTPVDAVHVSPGNRKALAGTRWIWSMSRFGHEQLKQAGYDPLYVPHGIEASQFFPLGDEERQERRKKVGEHWGVDLTDKYVVTTVAANKFSPSRKNFMGMFAVMAEFMAKHEDVVWYLHTNRKADEPMDALIQMYGLDPERVFFPNPLLSVIGGYDPRYLNDVYNVSDTFLLLSHGEGFGLPIVEAQMAGCPVVVTDCSAMSELVMAGEKVAARLVPSYGNLESWWGHAIPEAAVAALENQYAKRGDLNQRKQAHQGAMAYEAETVWRKYMKPALLKMESEWMTDDHIARWSWSINFGQTRLNIQEPLARVGALAMAHEINNQYKLDKVDLPDGAVIVDIGANVGVVSLYLAKKFPNARVLAYEPMPEIYECLVNNIKDNQLENVQAFNMAVTGDGRDVTIRANLNDNHGGANIYNAPGSVAHTVPSTTLKAIKEEHQLSKIHLLKIDCEGAEYEILADETTLADVEMLRGELHINNHFNHGQALDLSDRINQRVPDSHLSIIHMADSVDSPNGRQPMSWGEGTLPLGMAKIRDRTRTLIEYHGETPE